MSDRPVVGLVLNYRDAERTTKCIHSLLNDGASHVLVWDNSADHESSATSLRAMLGSELRVDIQISPSNLGFAAGVNHGLKWIHAQFPQAWVLLLNNDAILLPGAMGAMTKALLENTSAVIAYPTIDHGGRHIGTAFYQRHFGLITTKHLPASIPHASGCCQLLAPERLSGNWFDEDFFMYGEDVELGYRLGQRMAYVQGIWIRHEGSASSRIGSLFYEARMIAAHLVLARKLARGPFDLWLLFSCRAGMLLIRAILRVIRYRSLIPLQAIYEGMQLAHTQNDRWKHLEEL